MEKNVVQWKKHFEAEETPMTEEIQLKNGSVLVAVTGYSGESDFYTMYDIIGELLQPEHATYGVDSMCVDGSFRKDGILVRMSSECVTDDCCFHYDKANMPPEDVEKVQGWIQEIVTELHKRLPR
jgi:hypothetical protein